MRPERALVAERALANHCPELLGGGVQFAALPALAKLGAGLAPALAARLSTLAGGEPPVIVCEAPRMVPLDELLMFAPALSSCALYGAGDARLPFAAQLDARAVLTLVDRAFGGRGTVPDPLPETLPLSADLMAAQIMQLLAEALVRAVPDPSPIVAVLRRADSLDRLEAFAPSQQLAVLELAVTEGDRPVWRVTLGFPVPALAALVTPVPKPDSRGGKASAADPLAEPFGAMPLTLLATLVDMRVPIAAISALHPGALLPVSVAREVPLVSGGTAFAHGTVGALDDRVALRLTRAFSDSLPKGTA